jgi:hypothetical protein
MKAVRENFPDSSFTQLDILHLVSMTRAGVRQNLKTLLVRQELVVVGWRSGGRGSTLYALPDSAAAKTGMTFEVPSAVRITPNHQRTTREQRNRREQQNRYGIFPGETAFKTLSRLSDLYGNSPFVRRDAASDLDMPLAAFMRQSASLEKHGFIRLVGRQDPAPGRPGHLAKLYVVTDAEVPVFEQSRSSGQHHTRSPLDPGRSDTAKDQGRLALLKEAIQVFGADPFTSFDLAEAAGVPMPTVYQRVRALVDAGLLLEAGLRPHEDGRRRSRLWRVAQLPRA